MTEFMYMCCMYMVLAKESNEDDGVAPVQTRAPHHKHIMSGHLTTHAAAVRPSRQQHPKKLHQGIVTIA